MASRAPSQGPRLPVFISFMTRLPCQGPLPSGTGHPLAPEDVWLLSGQLATLGSPPHSFGASSWHRLPSQYWSYWPLRQALPTACSVPG